ncbi:MAG TPA: non-homologous end-joining DNA ligase [Candidatus Limnocylindria bacterium]|jgi:bifunctional non-homologous end joining protein LigD|nr:non-homologous end-joining DNA ligase [Candidatus Limnocylindria bacterium]
MRTASTLEIDHTEVSVSNLDKVLYPTGGFTKGQVIDYYIHIAPCLLPHLAKRPITLKRYPDGVEGAFFYERQCPSHRPAWVRTASAAKQEGGEIQYCVIDTLPALVWAANLADIELHTFLHRAPRMNEPTMVAFDLDPGPPADIVLCAKVALKLKSLMDGLQLECFAKTSGSKGMQVYVPLNTRVTYDQTKTFARLVAEALEKHLPDKVVSKMNKNIRSGKVLVDWSQNDSHKTTISVYSLRAKEFPTVSMPVTWEEVDAASRRKSPGTLRFEAGSALNRADKLGDLFQPVLSLKQKLPGLDRLQ